MELTIGANSIVPTLKLELNIQIFGIDLSELDFSAYILSNQNQKVRGDDDMIFTDNYIIGRAMWSYHRLIAILFNSTSICPP